MQDWRTSLFGLLAATSMGAGQAFPQYAGVTGPMAAVFTALLGYYAKDSGGK